MTSGDVSRLGACEFSLFELLLPAGMQVLSGELAQIDVLLDDERHFVPFSSFYDPVEGRPSIPIETYLRLMFREVPLQPRLRTPTHYFRGN